MPIFEHVHFIEIQRQKGQQNTDKKSSFFDDVSMTQ